MMRAAAVTAVCAAAYGFALGSAHSELYAVRNVAKFPLLILVTAGVCALAYWIVARGAGTKLTFLEAQRASWRLFHDLAILLASLSPVVFFLAGSARARDDGRLGEYDEFLAFNVAVVGAAGTLALVLQARRLFTSASSTPARAAAIVAAWLVLSLGVGGQAAFYLRPFFGFPATRGYVPPFFLGAQADLRGATNFYEAVWQTIRRPALPTWLDERGRAEAGR